MRKMNIEFIPEQQLSEKKTLDWIKSQTTEIIPENIENRKNRLTLLIDEATEIVKKENKYQQFTFKIQDTRNIFGD